MIEHDETFTKLTDEQLSFASMIRLLRCFWVLDMGSILEEVFEDGGMVPVQLYLNTGIWKENKVVLDMLKKIQYGGINTIPAQHLTEHMYF